MRTPSILIVDDAGANVASVESVLAAEGFRTLTANDGPSARALARDKQPDLILLDIVMPGESGFETCARLKSNPATADIPIIFLSALDDTENKVTGLKSGGVDYVSKPVHGEEMLARVRVHLRIREANRILLQQTRARLQQLREAQAGMLIRPADFPGGSFAVFYRPLEEASGDFYDVTPVGPDTVGYFVADVSGHGVSAAFFTSAIKALLRQHSSPLFSTEDAMRGIDSAMRHVLGAEQFVTACYARLNHRTGRLSIVSAGHPPAIVTRASGRAEAVEMESEPLGVFHSVVLQHKALRLRAGDRVFLYTDGLIEMTAGRRNREGVQRLLESTIRHCGVPLDEATSSIAADIWPGEVSAKDDLLLLGVEARA